MQSRHSSSLASGPAAPRACNWCCDGDALSKARHSPRVTAQRVGCVMAHCRHGDDTALPARPACPACPTCPAASSSGKAFSRTCSGPRPCSNALCLRLLLDGTSSGPAAALSRSHEPQCTLVPDIAGYAPAARHSIYSEQYQRDPLILSTQSDTSAIATLVKPHGRSATKWRPNGCRTSLLFPSTLYQIMYWPNLRTRFSVTNVTQTETTSDALSPPTSESIGNIRIGPFSALVLADVVLMVPCSEYIL